MQSQRRVRRALIRAAVMAALLGTALTAAACTDGSANPEPDSPGSATPLEPGLCEPGDRQCRQHGTVRWAVALTGDVFARGDFLYTADADGGSHDTCRQKAGDAYYWYQSGDLRAFDADTGELRWRVNLPETEGAGSCWGWGRLLADDRQVMVGLRESDELAPMSVWVLAADTGELEGRWEAPFSAQVARLEHRLLHFGDGRSVWANRRDGDICAADNTTGDCDWTAKLAPWAGAHTHDGTLYLDDSWGDENLTANADRLQRVDLATGERSELVLESPVGPGARLWSGTSLADYYTGMPGVLLLTTNQGAAAVSSDDGQVLWEHDTGEERTPEDTMATVHISRVDPLAGTVFLKDPRGIRAVDAATGERAEPTPRGHLRGWTINGGVAVSSHEGLDRDEVVGYDALTAEIRWRIPGLYHFTASNGDDTTDPRVLIGTACASPLEPSPEPSGEDRRCPAPMLVAVTL